MQRIDDQELLAAANDVTREQLHAYLEESLSEAESSNIEQLLRASEKLRERLQEVRNERDRGEHSLGAIWRREGITCLSRAQLNQYRLKLLDPNLTEYVDFHLNTIQCPTCLANLDDLVEEGKEDPSKQTQRRKKIIDSGAGFFTKDS